MNVENKFLHICQKGKHYIHLTIKSEKQLFVCIFPRLNAGVGIVVDNHLGSTFCSISVKTSCANLLNLQTTYLSYNSYKYENLKNLAAVIKILIKN